MPAARTPSTLLVILGYVLGVLLLGAVLAPALWFAARAVIQASPEGVVARILSDREFPGYFNRAALLAAVLGLGPLLKALRMNWGEVMGDVPFSRGWSQFVKGFIVALVLLVIMAYACWESGACRIITEARRQPGWLNPLKPLLSGLAVGVIEEFLFRGAVLGILCRTLGMRAGLWWTTCIFSLLHFMKPPAEGTIQAADVTWTSGFWIITQLFRGFGHWENVIAEFLLLAAVGWSLARVRLASGGLWASIGLHAGWVAGMKYFGQIVFTTHALRSGEFSPWLVKNTCRAIVSPIVGIVPLLTVLLTGLIALWMANRWRKGDAEKGIATTADSSINPGR